MDKKQNILRVAIAGILALFFGGMAVIAGGRVLTGIDQPDQIIHTWLVAYNVIAGMLSIITAIGIWLRKQWANKTAFLIFAGHFIVFLSLGVILLSSGNVEYKSVIVMIVRTAVWGVVLLLVGYFPTFIFRIKKA